MNQYYGIAEAEVTHQLELAVNCGKVKKFVGIKGKESYRDADFPTHQSSRRHSADLRLLVATAIESLANSNGSKISSVEEHIRTTHALDLSRADITPQLKVAVAHGVTEGLFTRKGAFVKVVTGKLEELRQKDNMLYMSEGVEPSPVCGFCLGTSECNKEKQTELLLSCVDCGNSGHPSCLKFSKELTRQVLCERWQCIECKVCSFCKHSGEAEDLLFCDSCDKGFHKGCLQPPMEDMPSGFWACCLCTRHTEDQGGGGVKGSARGKRRKTVATPVSTPVATPATPSTAGKKSARKCKKNEDTPVREVEKGSRRRRKKQSSDSCTDSEAFAPGQSSPGNSKHPEVSEDDRKLFDKISEKCRKALKISPAETTGERFPKVIDFGEYEIETWYSSPLPFEYSRLHKLFFCEFCLQFMKSKEAWDRHQSKCSLKQPPANEIYRHKDISLFEADGAQNKLYCRNLCLLAKMFLDHKTLYFDVEPFLFYVLTRNDEHGSHVVGYFSKEKSCLQNYNLSCIMTLPNSQRKGYGKLLIEFSYLLSQLEGKPGTPEKPLSDLGLISYRSFWRAQVLGHIAKSGLDHISIPQISRDTGILSEDIVLTLYDLNVLDFTGAEFKVTLDKDMVSELLAKQERPGYHIINKSALIWSPVVAPTVLNRRQSTAESPQKQSGMLLSPKKKKKKALQKDPLEEEEGEEGPKPLDTFTKYYPNWIPAGEDADEYRYVGDCEKGEIEGFVMKKTPGRKKRVNRKSSRRSRKVSEEEDEECQEEEEEEEERGQQVEEEGEGEEEEEGLVIEEVEQKEEDTDHVGEDTKPEPSKGQCASEVILEEVHGSPAISYNEVSSTSDIKIKVEQQVTHCHSTTCPPSPSVSPGDAQSPVQPPRDKKRVHSDESSEDQHLPESKKPRGLKHKVIVSSSLSLPLPAEPPTRLPLTSPQHTDTEDGEEEEEASSLFLSNSLTNIYLKSASTNMKIQSSELHKTAE
eukprot:sb/3461661/